MAALVARFRCWPLRGGKCLLVCESSLFHPLSYSRLYFGDVEFLESLACLVGEMLIFLGRVGFSILRSVVPTVLNIWSPGIVAGFALYIPSHMHGMQILLHSSCTALLQLSHCLFRLRWTPAFVLLPPFHLVQPQILTLYPLLCQIFYSFHLPCLLSF